MIDDIHLYVFVQLVLVIFSMVSALVSESVGFEFDFRPSQFKHPNGSDSLPPQISLETSEVQVQ